MGKLSREAYLPTLLFGLFMLAAHFVVVQLTEGHVQSGHHLNVEQVPDPLPSLHGTQAPLCSWHVLALLLEWIMPLLGEHFWRREICKAIPYW